MAKKTGMTKMNRVAQWDKIARESEKTRKAGKTKMAKMAKWPK